MKKYQKPQAFVAPCKDHRFAGTFEVLVPVPERVKPQRAAGQFETQQAAEAWLHSAEGKDTIADIYEASAKQSKSARN